MGQGKWDKVIILATVILFCSGLGGYFFQIGLSDYWRLVSIFALQGISFLIWLSRVRAGKPLPFAFIFGLGLIARIGLWFSEPLLEDDFYRYMWDGRVLAHGINPYLYAPLDQALNHIDIGYRALIGYGDISTIYPPLIQYIFALTYLIAPDSLMGLKVVFTGFDLGTGLILVLWFRHLKINPAWSFLYFLNPLVLKEIANSAHFDAIPMFLTFLSVYLFTIAVSKNWLRSLSWVVLGLAVLSKLFPLLLVPLYARVDQFWKRNILIFGSTLVLLYLPFVSAGQKLFSGTRVYAEFWIFNAGLFQITKTATQAFLRLFDVFLTDPFFVNLLEKKIPSKVIMGSLLMYGLFLYFQKTQTCGPTPSRSSLGAWLSPDDLPCCEWLVCVVAPSVCLPVKK